MLWCVRKLFKLEICLNSQKVYNVPTNFLVLFYFQVKIVSLGLGSLGHCREIFLKNSVWYSLTEDII